MCCDLAFSCEPLLTASLLSVLREERDHILSLVSLGLTPKQAFELITDPLIGQAQVEDDPTEGLVDASDREEGGGVITYWNDIEKDKRFSCRVTNQLQADVQVCAVA